MLRRVKRLQSQRSRRGFTLIELMISLCIIGMLATIAIPNFLNFRARAMQSEVKANLGAVHRAEIAYQAEHNTYTDCLEELSWRPSGNPRYIYGFLSDEVPAPCGVNDSAELAAALPSSGFRTVNMSNLGTPLTDADLPAGSTATGDGFQFGAAGNLDADSTLDQWSLTEKNIITNLSNDPGQ